MFSAARNRVASTNVGTQRSSWAAVPAMSGGDERAEKAFLPFDNSRTTVGVERTLELNWTSSRLLL
jgi:hypothetical protein